LFTIQAMQTNYPYPECEVCKDLGDCKHLDIALDGLGTPLPPEICQKPIDVMKATMKKRKKENGKHGIS
jgi:hypothetical protein